MSCLKQFSKIILIICNVLFVLAGIAILAVCVLLKVSSTSKHIQAVIEEHAEAKNFSTAIIVMVTLGTLILLISLIGCCAAIFESRFFLGIYIFFLSLITVTEVSAGIFVGVVKTEIRDHVAKAASDVLLYKYGIVKDITDSIDVIQYEMNCCGVNNYTDYQAIVLRIKKAVPLSCCYLKNTDPLKPKPKNTALCESEAAINSHTYKYLHGQGCITSLEGYIKKYSNIILAVALSIALFEVMVIILACCICRKERDYGDKEVLIN